MEEQASFPSERKRIVGTIFFPSPCSNLARHIWTEYLCECDLTAAVENVSK